MAKAFWCKVTRAATFLAGLAGLGHQTVVADKPDPEAMTIFTGLMTAAANKKCDEVGDG